LEEFFHQDFRIATAQRKEGFVKKRLSQKYQGLCECTKKIARLRGFYTELRAI